MIIHDGFWKSKYDFLILIHSNFLFVMHDFRDNEVLLQAGYDVIVISPLGGASGEFSWRILIERAWLLMTFYKNVLSRMNDFRDNEVLLQAEYDVTMISSLGGASGEFSWRILKERPRLPDSVP